MDGYEASQIYVKNPVCMIERPVRELREFAKTFIKAGETTTLKIKLDRSAFEYYLQPVHDYFVENGTYTIEIGASSRDIRLSQKVKVNLPEETQFSPYARGL